MRAYGPNVNPDEFPVTILNHEPIAILPAGKEMQVVWQAWFHWERASVENVALPMALLILTLFIHDVHGRLHELTYEILATRDVPPLAGATNLAPGLQLGRRYTKITAAWCLRLRARGNKYAEAAASLRKRIEASRQWKAAMQQLVEMGILKKPPQDSPK